MRAVRPKISGMNISAYIIGFYYFAVLVSCFHMAVVLMTIFGPSSGYVVASVFGIAGPACILHWVISLMFGVAGARAILCTTDGCMDAAKR